MVTADKNAAAATWAVEHTLTARGLTPLSAIVRRCATELDARTYVADTVHRCGLERGQSFAVRDAAGAVVCRVWRDA